MAMTKTEKIESIQVEIKQLENQRKRLIQQQKEQERKDRTKRLCKRAGLMESLLPDTIALTDDQFKTFLEKSVLTENSRKALGELITQGADGLTGQVDPVLIITNEDEESSGVANGAGTTA